MIVAFTINYFARSRYFWTPSKFSFFNYSRNKWIQVHWFAVNLSLRNYLWCLTPNIWQCHRLIEVCLYQWEYARSQPHLAQGHSLRTALILNSVYEKYMKAKYGVHSNLVWIIWFSGDIILSPRQARNQLRHIFQRTLSNLQLGKFGELITCSKFFLYKKRSYQKSI